MKNSELELHTDYLLRMWSRITFPSLNRMQCCPMVFLKKQAGYVKSRDEHTDELHARH